MRDAGGKMWRLGVPLALFAVALFLRLIGIGWGLKNDLHNQSYHPDELPIWAASQRIEPAKFNFTPGFYNYGTLYLTCLRISTDMVEAYTGSPDPKNADSTWGYVSRCHLAGRVINALAGAGCVALAFVIVRRLVGRLGGIAAGLALLLAPAHVVHSRFQTVDIFAAFLLVVSAYYALRLIPISEELIEPKKMLSVVILSAIFAGLSAGTKYTGVLGLLTLWTVLFLCHRPRFLRDAMLSLLVCAGAFVVATPGSVLDFQRFRADVGFELAHSGPGHGLVFAATSSGYLYHIGNLITGMGGLVLLVGAAGLAYATYRRHRWAIALLAFALPYYLLIGHAQDKYMRYTFPLDLAIAVGFGYAVAVGHRRRGWGHAVVALGIFGLGGALSGTIMDTGWMVGADPRDAAARYLKTRAQSDPAMVVGLASDPWFWSPPLFPDTAEPRSVPFAQRMAQMDAAHDPKVAYYIPADAAPHPFDARMITETKPEYIAISSLESDPLERLLSQPGLDGDAQAAAAQYKSFAVTLPTAYTVEHIFGYPENAGDAVEDMQYIQPVVDVWKRKPER